MNYIVIDIGCIECEIPTTIVGVFSSKQIAEEEARKYQEARDFTTAQIVEVFEIPEVTK